MRLDVLTEAKERAQAQHRVQAAMEILPVTPHDRKITYGGGDRRGRVHTLGPGRLWAICEDGEEGNYLRHRNWFGLLPEDPRSVLAITVQCNVTMRADDPPVHGFFARDRGSGRTYLMHDGTLGGGVKGVGRYPYLEWVGSNPLDIWTNEEVDRGLIVADLDADDIPLQVEAYVRRVSQFKEHARAGTVVRRNSPTLVRLLPLGGFSGLKAGPVAQAAEYETYHDDIVSALVAEQQPLLGVNDEVGRTDLIDIAVARAGRLAEIFEVKTSLRRQSLYTAIGQLIVLGGTSPDVRRTIVLPQGDLPDDVTDALTAQRIAVRRFDRAEETGDITLSPPEPRSRL